MQKVFKKLTCDRCGEEVDLAEVGEAKNGAAPIFDKPPFGWTTIDGLDVCLNCSATYKATMHKFWNP